jgi:thymidylate synthase (FAD)
MFTQWYWTGSLFAWARVCRHRLAPDAQKEVRDVALQIDPIMRAIFPVSWSALIDD